VKDTLQAPFPWFGGKSKVAAPLWQAFGDADNYIEPFAGSLAVLLGRPADHRRRVETINDLDGMISNFWRSVAAAPAAVAHHADWPVSEVDLHARHLWLVRRREDLTARLMGDPGYYDPQIAGWWVWGICQWIGSGWCSGEGPWTEADGRLVKGNRGMGINRQLPHLGNRGMGINRQLPHLGDSGRGAAIREWFERLRDRLRDVRVCCGDWRRVVQSPAVRLASGAGPVSARKDSCAILLDPPYGDEDKRDMRCYGLADSGAVAGEVRAWAIEHGGDLRLRIALCSYDGAGPMPDGWQLMRWTTGGGYGNYGNGAARDNCARECVWLSPGCLGVEQPTTQAGLFGPGGDA